ncbi:MAG: hypothetical protein A2758_01325 [Candidatus Zambryskibacteria bacterium RIFCSPHIGHO2_01_FULL_49_18]|uniref:YdbS-like PH domain-containing protein n=2 Tax=Candidatus Zambryskiibacteriota TaxID=1817925 RepID=A0A1G2T1A1_9BACT|nr:MAG: hypothetical protein A2758_01325 [Candidatus Zambryskibacteria bacterium RIFCSPHIGHO2_01_FULL_49_18]OHB05315.1 MAG: hypothetical protein A3A26_01870 [Candidatus Zambryskibacteria bacterium RIFCSPLOWO2_01_FULL_47_14]
MIIDKIIAIFSESSRTFEEQEKGEEVVLLLRRHPFVALLPVGMLGLFALVPIFIILIFYSYIAAGYLNLFLFLASVYYIAIWLITFYYLMMYTLNTVIVTDRRVIERNQLGFFSREVSELHVYRIQDITVSTKGIIPTMLHYGDVIVQTAGTEQRFIFQDLPKPENVKGAIMKVVSMANAGVKPAVDK